MKVITVTNRKGGVGKSTWVSHLAAGLAIKGHRVGIVDVGPQGHISPMFGIPPYDALYEVLVEDAPLDEAVIQMPIDQFSHDDTPAQGELYLLAGHERTADIPYLLEDGDLFVMLRLMEDFAASYALDYIIVDTQPTRTRLDAATWMATDGFLYITELDYLSYEGLTKAMDSYERFNSDRERFLGRQSHIVGIVPNKMRSNTVLHQENVAALGRQYGVFKDGGLVLPPCRHLIAWPESTQFHQRPVYVSDPKSEAAQDAWHVVNAVELRVAAWA